MRRIPHAERDSAIASLGGAAAGRGLETAVAGALRTYMGHANILITMDRYGHSMPGNEAEAAGLLDRYLDAAGSSADARAV